MNKRLLTLSFLAIVLTSGCTNSPTPPPPCGSTQSTKASFVGLAFQPVGERVPCNQRKPINTPSI